MVIVVFILSLVAGASSTDNDDYIENLDATAKNIQDNSNLILCMKRIVYSLTTGAKSLDKDLLKSCYVIDSLKETVSHSDSSDVQTLLKLLSLFASNSKSTGVETGDTMKRFVDGMVRGVKELKTPADLMVCVKDSREIISQLKKSMDSICSTTPAGIETGCQLLLKGMKEIFSMLNGCLNGYRVLVRLRDKVNAGDPKQMQKAMINSLGKYYQLAEDAAKGFMYNDYEQAGLKIGAMLESLFLSQTVF